MVDATRPIQHDRMLPAGTLRDLPEALHRAHYFIVTKCPEKMAPIDRRILRKVLIQVAYQKVYFTRFESFMPQPLFPGEALAPSPAPGGKVIALSGIGNPKPFVASLREYYDVVEEVSLDDHHVYKVRDMSMLARMVGQCPEASIVTTEKDAVKMVGSSKIPEEVRRRLYYMPINISFIEDSATDFLQNSKKMLEEIKRRQPSWSRRPSRSAPKWASFSEPVWAISPTRLRRNTPSTTTTFPISPSRRSRATRDGLFSAWSRVIAWWPCRAASTTTRATACSR